MGLCLCKSGRRQAEPAWQGVPGQSPGTRVRSVNQTTIEIYRNVMLSAAKHLTLRPFAEFILFVPYLTSWTVGLHSPRRESFTVNDRKAGHHSLTLIGWTDAAEI